jgi:hypothetical protein
MLMLMLVLVIMIEISFAANIDHRKHRTSNIERRTLISDQFSHSRWRPADVACDDKVLHELDTTG